MIGFDIYVSDHTHLIADAHQVPFADATFDAVLIQAVLEHVLEPGLVVKEIWRVLKGNGLVYAETPFMQQVHEGAYDFTRFTESGHRWLFRDFSLIDSGVVAGPGYAMLWSVDFAIRGVLRSKRAGLWSRRITAPVQLLDRLTDPRYAVDSASAVYFFGQRAEKAIPPSEIVAHYQGAQ